MRSTLCAIPGQCGLDTIGRQHAGEKAILPQVADPFGSRVVVLRITPRHVAHQDAQGVLSFWHRNEMNVVGRQAIAQHMHAGFGKVLAKQPEVGMTILPEASSPEEKVTRSMLGAGEKCRCIQMAPG